ncbi:fumarylacetoacetate hydrolase family protein [Gallicola sp. Sow4_E12]|uniref:fumarylacetoacetate hydrolase family protein n=1 Tax=Gallicola sp. Sow4_E12 TaxID=3438785 RepID=UPI003F90C8A8
MKLIRFKDKQGNIAIGLEKDDCVVDLKEIHLSRQFTDLNEFIAEHNEEDIETLQDFNGYKEGEPLDEVEVLAPFKATVHDVICVGLNYKEHIEESRSSAAENAVYFSKRSEVISGPEDEVLLDLKVQNSMDYEAELAIVIGKRGKNISEEDALDYIFGFTILNDFTARELQQKHGQWFKGKSLDGFTSIGPAVVYKGDFTFPLELDIESRVNGEARQGSNTRLMIRDIGRLIYELSQGVTLVPGDIIATGTPKGVGMGFTPPKYLKAGDTVECEIEGIGVLRNTIVSE